MLGLRKQRRIAFLAGVGSYQHFNPLLSCLKSYDQVHDSLEALDFEIFAARDCKTGALETIANAFLAAADDAELAIFYFCGHGIQHEGENHLLGTDARSFAAPGEAYDGLKFWPVFKELSKKTRNTIAILDACRTSPIAAEPVETVVPSPIGGRGRGRQRAGDPVVPQDPPAASAQAGVVTLSAGLAAPPAIEAENVFIAYAAAPDKPALADESSLTFFTEALVNQLDVPGLTIDRLFQRVADEVKRRTGDRQQPYTTTSGGFQRVTLRPRTVWPTVSMFLLSTVGLFVCYALSALDLFSTNTFAGQSIFFGGLFALLTGFAVWRWGGAVARPALAAAFAIFIWAFAAFFYAAPSGSTPADWVAKRCTGGVTLSGGTTANCPRSPELDLPWVDGRLEDLLFALVREPPIAAAMVVLFAMLFVSTEVARLRTFLGIAGPVVTVYVAGLAVNLMKGLAASPSDDFSGRLDYFSAGVWIIPFAVAFGLVLTVSIYPASNRDRRLRRPLADPGKVAIPAAAAAALGLIAAFSGAPISESHHWFSVAVPMIEGRFINLVPGVAVALGVGGTIWFVGQRGWWQPILATFLLWVFVLWLMQGTKPIEAWANYGAIATTVAGGLFLGLGIFVFIGLMQPRVWRVAAWLFAALAPVIGTAPYAVWHGIANAHLLGLKMPDGIAALLGSAPDFLQWTLLYSGWAASVIGALAYALAAESRPTSDAPQYA